MACRLFGAKPLSEPVLPHRQLHIKDYISVKFYLRFKSFYSEKCAWKCLPKWRPFYPGRDEIKSLLACSVGYCDSCFVWVTVITPEWYQPAVSFDYYYIFQEENHHRTPCFPRQRDVIVSRFSQYFDTMAVITSNPKMQQLIFHDWRSRYTPDHVVHSSSFSQDIFPGTNLRFGGVYMRVVHPLNALKTKAASR